MAFSDLFFLFFFLPLCLLIYFHTGRLRTKNTVLIVFSLIFYAWGKPVWLVLLLGSAVFNWFFGLKIGEAGESKLGKILTGSAVAVNLVMLFVFKYAGFFVEILNGILRTSIPVPNLTQPIGLSFYTFMAISYILDVAWETSEPQKSFKNFLLYISFFPHMTAGPIVRYETMEKELTARKVRNSDMYEGIVRLCLGLAKKVIIADGLNVVVTSFFGNDISGLSFAGTWYTVILYSLYVYFDFSGYSDMAIGIARMFGFHFEENFNYPFMCSSIAEFWNRWHISLGTFFRDYLLYVPIFGKRRKYGGLFLVWFSTGLWHGASWNYIFWGLYYGLFILLEGLIGKKRLKSWPAWWKHLYCILIIVIGFGIFYFEDLGQLGYFLRNISGISMVLGKITLGDIVTMTSLKNNIFLILIALLLCFPVFPKVRAAFENAREDKVFAIWKQGLMVVSIILMVVCAIMLVDSTSHTFLYWQF